MVQKKRNFLHANRDNCIGKITTEEKYGQCNYKIILFLNGTGKQIKSTLTSLVLVMCEMTF